MSKRDMAFVITSSLRRVGQVRRQPGSDVQDDEMIIIQPRSKPLGGDQMVFKAHRNCLHPSLFEPKYKRHPPFAHQYGIIPIAT